MLHQKKKSDATSDIMIRSHLARNKQLRPVGCKAAMRNLYKHAQAS